MRLDPKPNRISTAAPTAPLNGPARTSAPATAPLPSLGTDALSLSGKAGSSASLSDVLARAKAAVQQKPEWTMAVNLTTTLSDKFGAAPKAQQLKDLAKETEGKPVTIVAQQVTQGENGPVVERFVIKDGKVSVQGKHASEGFAKDLEGLTAWAAKEHPGQRMGVIIQSHGNAIDGMSGDNGGATLGEISAALSRGLKGSGRDALDILDFDACLMGQQEVVNAMRGVADHVIASSEVELANDMTLGGSIDGQPTQEMLRALIANPEMDAEAFATRTIALASQAARPFDVDRDGVADADTQPMNATPTLSHYDMEHAEAMAKATDALGSALTAALKDPASRQAIEDVIARAPRFSPGQDLDAVNRHQRDLKGFSEGLEGAIASGKLKDPSGAIRKALTDATKALDDLVGSHFGVDELALPTMKPQNYSQLGGMGVFLPSAEFLHGTPENMATPLDQIVSNAEFFSKQVLEQDDAERTRAKEFFLRGAGGAMGEIWRSLPPERRAEFTPLREAFVALEQAETPEAISQAAKRYGAAASKLTGEPLGQLLKEQKKAERQEAIAEAFSLAGPHMTAGWSGFTEALRGGK